MQLFSVERQSNVRITVTRKFEFCYGHYLPSYKGKCKNYHGHNSVLEVEIGNTYDGHLPSTPEERRDYPGMVIDFSKIKEIVQPIVEEVDHQFLNQTLTASFQPPTAEVICMWFWTKINESIRFHPKYELVRLRLSETPNSYAEIKRKE